MNTKGQNAPLVEPQLMYTQSNQYSISMNSFNTKWGGLYFRHGWHKTGTQLNHYEIDIERIKHAKEVRRSGFSDNPNQYQFGRLNVVFFLRNGMGQTVIITDKPYKNAVGLNFVYSIGSTIAFLKPVFIEVYYPYEGGKTGGYLVSEKYDPEKHTDVYKIYGNSSFGSGLSETKLVFGGYGRSGLQVEWGPYPDETRSLEAGITVDAFSKGLPIMAHSNYDQVFYGFYIAFNWGKKK